MSSPVLDFPVRPGRRARWTLLVVATAMLAVGGYADSLLSREPHAGDFALSTEGRNATVYLEATTNKAVARAAGDLAADIERVTGRRPPVVQAPLPLQGEAVIVGVLGESAVLDALVAAGKLEAAGLKGSWESFVIQVVEAPLPGVPRALVIAGSDRRGAIYGLYEISAAIGVSPWYWWADVTPTRQSTLFIAAGTRRFGPPSVQYRGIFLNDEDWGLQPWAAKTFEPETGDIGPKTYAKICELLLRLKANTLWPAMHACTKAFNLYPQNKLVADDYGIVMGSSHAEPMLLNNVTEWTAPHEEYNYVTNRAGVRKYWEDRVKENGKFENIYTLGMRGIHDSNMQGPKTDAERIATLEQIFTDQRAMLAAHVNPHVAQVPQMFCAYKEVLPLYRQGLKVPDDVTIVWPDDNFGYIRNYASAEEQQRSGGFGVYYHISYLGAPMSYLWLSTTPPALIWEEMTKAYDHGARKIWIVNVGDLKPAEIGTEFFLQLAWDIKRWNGRTVDDFLSEWAAREFGPEHAAEIAGVLRGYYGLNFERRPEHLQWWLTGRPPHPSPLEPDEIDANLNFTARLRAESESLAQKLSSSKRDAFEELVGYPVRGATLANQRYFFGERGEKEKALAADAGIKETTRHFNEEVAGGKWRGLMTLEPADSQWQSMRIETWKLPDVAVKQPATPAGLISIGAERFGDNIPRAASAWAIVAGLGVAVFPTNAPSVDPSKAATDAPRIDYAANHLEAGPVTLTVYLLPTHSLVAGRGLRFAVGLDDAPPQLVVCDVKDGSPEWAQGVLNNYVTVDTKLTVPSAGKHTLRLYGVDAGVVLTRVVIK